MANIKNPIVPGFNPDPSCICVDGTFYLVTSSFLFFPGIPVYTSKDLKEWGQIGNVISRPEQLDYSEGRTRPGTQFTGGIWAPTIRFHDGTFYVVTTFVYTHKDWDDYSRWVNVIFSTTDIHSNEWSNPIFFDFPGYDTSLFWDNDGKSYLTGSFYWRIRPEISQFEIDLKTGKSLSGEPRALWSGMGGMAPEAPHIYKKGNKYYLLIAEGGTEFGHCATMASAPSIWGPYTPCPSNPILTAASQTSLIQTVGHADIFEDTRPGVKDEDRWWVVSLASRVIEESRPIGRETVLLKVNWSGEWPIVDHKAIDIPIERLAKAPSIDDPLMNVLYDPGHHLLHLRVPKSDTIRRTDQSTVILKPNAGHRVPLSAPLGSPIFIGVRQRHLHFECQVELVPRPVGPNSVLPKGLEAGFTVYLDHERYYAGVSDGTAVRFVRMQPGGDAEPQPPAPRSDAEAVSSIFLRIRGSPEKYIFDHAPLGGSVAEGEKIVWEMIGEGPASGVSGGFTGTIIAIHVVPGESENGADFEVEAKGWQYRALAEE